MQSVIRTALHTAVKKVLGFYCSSPPALLPSPRDQTIIHQPNIEHTNLKCIEEKLNIEKYTLLGYFSGFYLHKREPINDTVILI